MNTPDFKPLLDEIGIKFNNEELLLNAFVHRSFLNENRGFKLPSNERLEFLGDACLELVVSEYLYKNYPQEPEGKLTSYRGALVNTQSLAQSAKSINLGNYLLLSKGEEEGGGRDSNYLMANTFEALVGAIYLDQGYKTAQKFIEEYVISKLDEIIRLELYRDPKSKLQELTQAQMSITPTYKVVSESGPDHDKTFEVEVYLNDKVAGRGVGSSKQKAEIAAAKNALEKLSTKQSNI